MYGVIVPTLLRGKEHSLWRGALREEILESSVNMNKQRLATVEAKFFQPDDRDNGETRDDRKLRYA